ncbi:MAG: hypothetical protein JST83_08830 [Bacteroidetes bacterium]|nr:hypothetical protein [Bacteroidota bacterium]
MKTLIQKTALAILLLLAFSFARAGFVPQTSVIGSCHGSDAAFVFDGTNAGIPGPYFVMITGNGFYHADSNIAAIDTIPGLSAGTYTLTMYPINYSSTGIFSYPLKVGYKINIQPTVNSTPCPLNQGSITTAATGGTAPYAYVWSNGAGNVSSISGLSGGQYALTVTDAASCTALMDTTVYATSPMTVGITTGGTVCNPTYTALATGGAGTVSYHWSDGSSSASISGTTGSTYYYVTATDANGCTAVQNVFTNSVSLQIDSANGSSVTVVNAGCNGGGGSITIHIRTGQAPYTWHWSGTNSTDSIASGLSAGGYAVTVTDANGCTGSRSYYLYSNNSVYASAYGSNPTCGQSDGTIQAYASGGVPPYIYSWSGTAGTGSQASSLASGTYTVTVTDQSGCSATASATLAGVAAYNVNVQATPTACDTSLHTGTATAVISGSGGTAPYTYTWYQYWGSSNVVGSGQTISGLQYQSAVSVRVVDANGCLPQNNYDSVYIGLDPSCYDHITGHIFQDANSNCTYDAGETAITGAYAVLTGTGGTVYASPDSTGFYDAYVLPGTYTVRLQLTGNGACLSSQCATSYTHSFTTTGQVSSGNDFGIDIGAQTFDLGVHPGCSSSVPGATKEYWIYYYNYGLVSAPGAVLSFMHDPNLTFVSSTPANTSYDNATHTITWNLGNMSPTVFSWSQVRMIFNTPNTLILGSYLTCVAQLSPSQGDCNPIDNTVSITDMVQGSHDPNEKEVYPSGGLTASDTVLNYTVRFQNDGNAPASLVVVKDTLSPYVDPASAIPGASSHPYKFTLSGNGLLTFTFENINLPDSVHDEPHSKGFVNYTVHTKPNLPIGTQVKNTANIYFDFNQPVVTNTTVNTRSDLTGFNTISNSGTMQVSITPNPVQAQSQVHFSGTTGDISFELMDVTGRKVMETTTDKDFLLSGTALAPGMYTYIARDQAGHIRSGKVSISH